MIGLKRSSLPPIQTLKVRQQLPCHTSPFNTYIHSSQCIDGPDIAGVIEPIEPTLIYRKKSPVHLDIDRWVGLPSWLSEDAKRAIFRSIAGAIETTLLQWNPPILVASQVKMPINDLHEVHTGCLEVSLKVSFHVC